MNRLTRCCLVAAFLAAAVTSARAAEVDALLPKETEQVVFVNFKQVLDSDIVKKYAMGQIKQAMAGEDVKAYLEAAGLDPMKDIDKATVGFWGSTGDDMKAVGVLRGKFDAKKLFDSAKAQADMEKGKVEIITEKVDGAEVVLVKFINEGDKEKGFYVNVADSATLIGATSKKLALDAVASFNKKEKAKLSKELTALVLKQDEKASMFYCMITEGKFKDVPAEGFNGLKQVGVDGEKLKEQLEKMNTMSITVRVGKEIKLDAIMGMKDADSAEEFNGSLGKLIDTANTFLPFIGNMQPKAKGLIDDLTKTLKAKAKDKDVTLTLALQAESIGSAMGKDE